jgi:two-component system, NtrC family, sensor kinase
VLERWLTLLLAETGGEHGLLGVELPAPGSAPRLQVVASMPPGWEDALWEVPALRTPGEPEPWSLQGLVHRALSTGLPVSAEGAEAAPGSVPLPAGGPSPRSFQVLPLHAGEVRVGFVGFSHPLGGAPTAAPETLRLLLEVGGSLLHGPREAWRREHMPHAPPPLQEELEQLRQTFASVQEEVWFLDGSKGALQLSHRWRELLGYAEGEVEPTVAAWMALCHPEDLPRIERSFREHAAGATPYAEFEYRARSKGGEWAWLRSRARVAARDEQGRPIRLVGTDTDLTALKRSEERLSALLQAIPDLIFRQRTDGTILDFSCSTAEETLLRPEHFVGRNIRDIPIPRHVADLTLVHIESVTREGLVAIYDYEIDMPHGRQSYEARMVRSGPDEVVSIIRNVTERRLVEERQAQLIQAEKLAAPGTEPHTVSAEQLARIRQLWEQGRWRSCSRTCRSCSRSRWRAPCASRR